MKNLLVRFSLCVCLGLTGACDDGGTPSDADGGADAALTTSADATASPVTDSGTATDADPCPAEACADQDVDCPNGVPQAVMCRPVGNGCQAWPVCP